MSSERRAEEDAAAAAPRQRPPAAAAAPRQRPPAKRAAKQLRLTSILSRGQLVDLANEVAQKEAEEVVVDPRASGHDYVEDEGEEALEDERKQGNDGLESATAVPTTTRRARSVEKHVDAVLHQFIEFEKKHFWNRSQISVSCCGDNGCMGGNDVSAACSTATTATAAASGAAPAGDSSVQVPAGSGDVLPQFNIHHDVGGGADVPRVLKAAVAARCGPLTSRVVRADVSGNGDTVKLLVELQDGFKVESVIMRHRDERSGRHTRATLCVSSQVGCKMGCKFCATGTLGELGNLSSGEILEQLVFANRINDTPMRNVVFMGMGEPLNNYANVVEAVRVMTSPRGFGLAAARVTVSTVGIVPRMEQLVRDLPHVAMALSLHAPTQELRADIVPAARGWKMDRLMAALDEYTRVSGRAALLQYILLAEVNDTPEVGAMLGTLLRGRNVKLNLIPYNPNHSVGITQFQAPSPERVAAFMAQLRAAGIFTTVRKEMGQDVAGACGQLALTVRQQAQQRTADADTAAPAEGGGRSAAADGQNGGTAHRGSGSPSLRDANRAAGAGVRPQASDIEDLIHDSASGGGGGRTVQRRPRLGRRTSAARRPHDGSGSSHAGAAGDEGKQLSGATPRSAQPEVVARMRRNANVPTWAGVALCVASVGVALLLLLPGRETTGSD
jgi:adenine C2-methylase RlmN of 23S rRNA A2503 and tRNA A37